MKLSVTLEAPSYTPAIRLACGVCAREHTLPMDEAASGMRPWLRALAPILRQVSDSGVVSVETEGAYVCAECWPTLLACSE